MEKGTPTGLNGGMRMLFGGRPVGIPQNRLDGDLLDCPRLEVEHSLKLEVARPQVRSFGEIHGRSHARVLWLQTCCGSECSLALVPGVLEGWYFAVAT